MLCFHMKHRSQSLVFLIRTSEILLQNLCNLIRSKQINPIELLDIIHWVNENTPARSGIIGSNDWRGWFILELTGNRSFVAYERMGEIFRNMTYAPNEQGYLIDTKVSDDPVNQTMNLDLERAKAYSNSLFTVYRIWESPKM